MSSIVPSSFTQIPSEKLSSSCFELLARSFWYPFGWSV